MATESPLDVLTQEEFLIRYSRISRSTLHNLERQGLGPILLSRRPWRIRRAEAEQWQDQEVDRRRAAILAKRKPEAALAEQLLGLQHLLRDLHLELNRVRSLHSVDLTGWQQDQLPRLQRSLQRSLTSVPGSV